MRSWVGYVLWMVNTCQEIPDLYSILHIWTLILETSLGELVKFTC